MYLKQQVTFNRFGRTRHTRLSVIIGEWFKAIPIAFSWKNLPRVIWSPPQLSRIIWRGSFRRGRNLRTDLKRSWQAENANDLFAEIANGYLQRSHRDDRVLSRWRSATPCFPWPSQTFRLPFSGWLTLDILRYSRGPPRVFILAHLSLRNSRVIGGNLEPQGDLFFSLSRAPRIVPSRRSQVLSKNE